jgi:hypothetical protein
MTCFWLWAIDNAPDGDVAGLSYRTIARAAQWTGDCDPFVGALVHAGFLDNDDGLRIHKWMDYAGRLIRQREAAVKRTQEWRETHPIPKAETVTHNVGVTYADVMPLPYPTVPNPTVPDPTIHEDTTAGAHAPGADAPLRQGKQPVQTVKKKRAAPANALHFEAICEASHLELSNLTDAMRGPANKATADTFNHGYTVEDIRVCVLELEKRDILVTPPSIAKWISRYNARSLGAGPPGNGRSPPAEPTAEEVAEEHRRATADQEWRDEERRQRAGLGLPGNPAEWTAYHEAKRRGEAWHRA